MYSSIGNNRNEARGERRATRLARTFRTEV